MAGHAVLAARIDAVRLRMRDAALRAGRDPGETTLIAVSKTHTAAVIESAVRAGCGDFGENRVQEAVPKIESVRAAGVDVRWHLVGHLQRNKVAAAIRHFDILHGVDSEALAEAISARAERTIAVLIEVNIAGERSKFGVPPHELVPLAGRVARLPHLDVRGLMTIAPQSTSPEDSRPVFRRLRELRDALGMRELSMGMTDDFEVAIEEGATMVRVGRAIFGERTGAGDARSLHEGIVS